MWSTSKIVYVEMVRIVSDYLDIQLLLYFKQTLLIIRNMLRLKLLVVVVCQLAATATAENCQSHPCHLPQSELQEYLQQPLVRLIDPRPAAQYALQHYPNSLNIPLYAIKTKSYLKDSPILILGDQAKQREALQTCSELLSLGFKARFLPNHQQALKVTNGAWSSVMPTDILHELSHANANQSWLLIDLDQSHSIELNHLKLAKPPQAQKLSHTNLSWIKKHLGELGGQGYQFDQIWVGLLLPEHLNTPSLLDKWQLELKDYQVFIVAGGLAALDKYLKQHQVINQTLADLNKPRSCGGP